jgi:hypothetical protein
MKLVEDFRMVRPFVCPTVYHRGREEDPERALQIRVAKSNK